MSNIIQRRGNSFGNGGADREFSPRPTVGVNVVSYHPKDPEGKRDHDNDFFYATLRHSVPEWGITVEPGTEVKAKVYLPVPNQFKPKEGDTQEQLNRKKEQIKKRRGVVGMSEPTRGPAMDPGSIITVEKAYVFKKDPNPQQGEPKDLLVIGGPFGQAYASSEQLSVPATAPEGALPQYAVYHDVWVSVRPETTKRETGKPSGMMDVLVAFPEAAAICSSAEHLDEIAKFVHENYRNGSSGVLVLARQVVPGMPEAPFLADDQPESVDKYNQEVAEYQAAMEQFLTDNAEAIAGLAANPNSRHGAYGTVSRERVPGTDDYRTLGYETIVQNLLKQNDAFKQILGNPNFVVEAIPMIAVNQAPSAIPSKAAQDPDKKDKFIADPSLLYGVYDKIVGRAGRARDVVTNAEKETFGMVEAGFVKSHVAVSKVKKTKDYFISTQQEPMVQHHVAFHAHDIPSLNTPSFHLAAIQEVGKKNGEMKKAHAGAKRQAKYGTAQAPDAQAPDAVDEPSSPAPGM